MDRLTCEERLLLEVDLSTADLLFWLADRLTELPEERLTLEGEERRLTPEFPDRLVTVPLAVDSLSLLERTTLDEFGLESV
ncbi:MAG: hypothetical protein WEB89_10360 [Balneolales bacterium]